jgi:hypothetical protein
MIPGLTFVIVMLCRVGVVQSWLCYALLCCHRHCPLAHSVLSRVCSPGATVVTDVLPGPFPQGDVGAARWLGGERGGRHRGQPRALDSQQQEQSVGAEHGKSTVHSRLAKEVHIFIFTDG